MYCTAQGGGVSANRNLSCNTRDRINHIRHNRGQSLLTYHIALYCNDPFQRSFPHLNKSHQACLPHSQNFSRHRISSAPSPPQTFQAKRQSIDRNRDCRNRRPNTLPDKIHPAQHQHRTLLSSAAPQRDAEYFWLYHYSTEPRDPHYSAQ